MRHQKFDHLAHAENHAPPEYAITMISKTWADRTLGKRVALPNDEAGQLLMAVAEPMKRWLDTLPAGASVSGRQLCDVFAAELTEYPGFAIAFLKVLYSMRHIGAFDGYFTKSTIKNRYGKPYVNFHRRIK